MKRDKYNLLKSIEKGIPDILNVSWEYEGSVEPPDLHRFVHIRTAVDRFCSKQMFFQ